MQFLTISVIVCTGPSTPAQMENVTVKHSYELALISWVVPYISYTPEMYTVLYSTSLSYLNTTGGQAFGKVYFTTNEESYSILLQGLTANTTYYYAIISSNSYGTTMSTVFSFQTLTNGEYIS